MVLPCTSQSFWFINGPSTKPTFELAPTWKKKERNYSRVRAECELRRAMKPSMAQLEDPKRIWDQTWCNIQFLSRSTNTWECPKNIFAKESFSLCSSPFHKILNHHFSPLPHKQPLTIESHPMDNPKTPSTCNLWMQWNRLGWAGNQPPECQQGHRPLVRISLVVEPTHLKVTI